MAAPKRVVCIGQAPQELIEQAKMVVEGEDVEFTAATGRLEGLDAIRRVKPDLVLLDLMMPGMDGWEVYQQMKADQDLKHIPVIIVTTKAQSIDKILGLHIARKLF